MGGSRGVTGGPDTPSPEKKSQNIGFLSKTGLDPLKNHKATVKASIYGCAIIGRWWPAYSGIWISTKMYLKLKVKFGHPRTKGSWSAHVKDWELKSPMYRLMNPHWRLTHNTKFVRESSDLIVECLTQDRSNGLRARASPTALPRLCTLARHINPFLVGPTISPQEEHPDMTQRMLTATQRINSNKQNSFNTYATEDWNNIYDISLQNKNADFISGIDDNLMFRFTKLMLSRLFRAHRHKFVELSRRFPFSLSRLK